MAIFEPLPEKVLTKHREEILELHKRCITSYLVQKGLKLKVRNKFFKLYDIYISDRNILEYWNIPTNLFVQALVKNILDTYFKFTNPQSHVRKHRKKSVRRKKQD